MKACLMKVNYDPKYLTPHIPLTASVKRSPSLSSSNLQSRSTTTRQVYNSNGTSGNGLDKRIQDQIHQRAKERLKRTSDDVKATSSSSSLNNASAASNQSTTKLPPPTTSNNRIASKGRQSDPKDHATGKATNNVTDSAKAKGNSQVRLLKLIGPEDATIVKPVHSKYQPVLSCNLPRSNTSPHRLQSPDALSKSAQFPKPVSVMYPRHLNQTSSLLRSHEHSSLQGSMLLSCQRSKTTLPSDYFNFRPSFQLDLERRARLEAEQAMKNGKIFTVMGPYPSLRAALRKRGWVEKFQNSSSGDGTVSLPKSVLAEINNDAQNETGLPRGPRKGESNVLAMMSHYVRNCTPALLFSVKAVDVVSRPTKSNQLVNHFGRASSITTKAGLCQCLRSVPWFENVDPNTFYPRCFDLGEADEKEAFIDDYRLTACMGFIKHFVAKCKERSQEEKINRTAASCSSISGKSVGDPMSANPQVPVRDTSTEDPASSSTLICPEIADNKENVSEDSDVTPGSLKVVGGQAKTGTKHISIKALKFAIKRCEKFLVENENDDIDILDSKESVSETEWNNFLDVYHEFINDETEVNRNASGLLKSCEDLLECLQLNWSQFRLDGIRDIWILKPGAKSRGRGIQCANRLMEITDAIATSDCALVAQKYIERPFLIYKTKFDIRQWFLVTDWNPLTMWFYNDCYLRFCSKEFSLFNFHVSIHLSNNSVQKYCTPDPNRSSKLPDDNMWTSDEFIEYLRCEGYGEVWKQSVIPGMKKAILCSLLSAQDQVEPRKGSFELFGADFMLDEDLQPWLIEINSSPSMARNTRATSKLVDCVMEDTIKVVLDRKSDRTCDVGRFELAYRAQMVSDTPHTDPDLSVEGKRIKQRIIRKSP